MRKLHSKISNLFKIDYYLIMHTLSYLKLNFLKKKKHKLLQVKLLLIVKFFLNTVIKLTYIALSK